jgi:pSer/pThr/pTyr-binding forkhead associated (FHA) protein
MMMARLYLKFEEHFIREIALSVGVVTIGRQPDNLLQIDNPAVSGHHAKVYWETNHYVVEDTDSFNGTYVKNRRISKAVLEDGDVILIGKHTIVFCAQSKENMSAQHKTADRSISLQRQLDEARPPQLDPTVVLDTRKAKEMLAQGAAAATAAGTVGLQMPGIDTKTSTAHVGIAGRRRIGTLTMIDGKTNRQHYVLSSKLSVIGKSEMATIRLRRWFAPRIAASIQQREDGYFIVAAGRNSKINVNERRIAAGQKQLQAGDVIEVAGIRAIFGYEG